MTTKSESLPTLVSGVSPLGGGAIDGTPRPKPARPRKPRREPADRSLTFFCSNPQCDHATWAPAEQAKHMAREFWDVAQALVRLAPESPEALLLTGGVILRDLTDDECREAYNLSERYKRAGVDELPVQERLRLKEYTRRKNAGELAPSENPGKPQEMCGRGLHPLAGDNVAVRRDGRRYCRACAREAARLRKRTPEARAYQNNYQRRRYQEDPEWRARRKASTNTDRSRERARSPEVRARVNARRAQRRREDPEYRARVREQAARNRQKERERKSSDPAARERENERRRERYRKKREVAQITADPAPQPPGTVSDAGRPGLV